MPWCLRRAGSLNLPLGRQQYNFVPRVECGFAPNWRATVSSTLLAGPSDRTGSGNAELEIFHNFNTEGLRLPAFAAALSTSTMLVADAYREQPLMRHMDYKIAEIGIGEQVTPFTVFVVGVGPDSPRIKITMGFSARFRELIEPSSIRHAI